MGFNVKAVMFDLDGTLVHTAPEIAEAINRMLAAIARPLLPIDQIERYIGEGAQMLIKRSVSQSPQVPDAAFLAQAEQLFFKYYAETVSKSQPYPGVLEGLATLKSRGLKLACVTNKPEKFTLPLLAETGLGNFFELVISGDTLPKKKPDPIQLQYICAKFDVMETEAMLVGDSMTDVKAAHAAGCYIVTVPYGYNQGKPIDESAVDATVENLTQLVHLFN